MRITYDPTVDAWKYVFQIDPPTKEQGLLSIWPSRHRKNNLG